MNTSIVQAKAAGQSTADLEDKRQTALQALAGDMNVTSFVDSTGAMRVYAGSGQSLIDETGDVPADFRKANQSQMIHLAAPRLRAEERS